MVQVMLRRLLSKRLRVFFSVYRKIIFLARSCDNWMHRNMKNGPRKVLSAGRFFVSLLVMFILVFGNILSLPAPFDKYVGTQEAEAAHHRGNPDFRLGDFPKESRLSH